MRKRSTSLKIIRDLQKELGFTENHFVGKQKVANKIAEKCGWPLIEKGVAGQRNKIHKYITNYINILNRVEVRHPQAYVYFIQAGSHIKIGVAKDIASRIASLQTGNANKIELLAYIPTGNKAQAYII